MFTELVEYGHKIEEKVKAMQSEIKKNLQGTNSEGKETGTQINALEQKEEGLRQDGWVVVSSCQGNRRPFVLGSRSP